MFFISYIPFSLISPRYGDLSAFTKLASSLDLNLAMSFGMVLIGKFEGAGRLILGRVENLVYNIYLIRSSYIFVLHIVKQMYI